MGTLMANLDSTNTPPEPDAELEAHEELDESLEEDLESTTREPIQRYEDIPYDDDEQLIRSKDAVLEDEEAYAIFKQDDGVVSWKIENLFDAEGKQYSKRELNANPPVLTIEGSNESKAEFILTKDFSRSMSEILNRVHYGYYGLEKKPKKHFTVASAKQAIIDAVGARPIGVASIVLLSIVVIVGLVAR